MDMYGMTSLQFADLRSKIADDLGVSIPLYLDLFPTPMDLGEFIRISGAMPLEVLPDVDALQNDCDRKKSIGLILQNIVQAMCVLLAVFILVLCFVPAFYMGKIFASLWVTFELGNSGRTVSFSFLPFVLPTFFLAFSVAVIVLKWVVVGTYRMTVVKMPSRMYF